MKHTDTQPMEFKQFAKAVNDNFQTLHAKAEQLYIVDTNREEIWEHYLKSFPEGSDPIFKERTEHDCNTCKNFIRDIGNVVMIKDGKLISIWDLETFFKFYPDDVSYPYNIVAKAMNDFIKSKLVVNTFLHYQDKVGNLSNTILTEVGGTCTFHHFHTTIPKKFVKPNRDEIWGGIRGTMEVFERGLTSISIDSIDIVLDLINQDSIYRGAEHKATITSFKKLKKDYDKLSTDQSKNIFIWNNINNNSSRIRNTVIGTLLTDISEGVELDVAVASFESKVAPQNYKRTSSVVTKGMIDQAVKKIRELDVEDALPRRLAKLSDITINNVLFADKRASQAMTKDPLMDMLVTEAKPSGIPKFDKVEEISIDKFIENVLPTAKTVEVFFENKHRSNLVSLVAPVNPDAHNILQWDNNFSWSYAGNVTDSIKERVKAAGGATEGFLRVSLSWYNTDDLDIHLYEPNGTHIYYGNKGSRQRSSGMLDVDMNVSNPVKGAVENIVYIDPKVMPHGKYVVSVHNFTKRDSTEVGYQIQTEYNGTIETYDFPKSPRSGDSTESLVFNWDGREIKFNTSGSKEVRTVDEWNLSTNNFIPVEVMALSPNFWDDQTKGNKHYFFFLEGCKNEEPTRGLYNEFLSSVFTPHRKTFEILGDKMKCPVTEDQLSGLGFSSTKREDLIVKVSGATNRILKIKF